MNIILFLLSKPARHLQSMEFLKTFVLYLLIISCLGMESNLLVNSSRYNTLKERPFLSSAMNMS